MIASLLRWLFGDIHDPAWKATGVKPMVSAPYDEAQAVRASRRAKTRSETGRVYRRPAKPQAAKVLPMRRAK